MARKFNMMNETALAPYVVADAVLDEVEHCAPLGLSDERRRAMSDRLGDRAEHIYAANPRFRKQLRAMSGRDTLYMFMRHWASAEIHKCCPSAFRQLPMGFQLGQELVCDRRKR